MRTALAEMGHQQQPTPVAKDNIAANSIFNGAAKKKISQAIDMRFYWVRDIILTKPFQNILVRGIQKPHSLCYKTPPDMAP